MGYLTVDGLSQDVAWRPSSGHRMVDAPGAAPRLPARHREVSPRWFRVARSFSTEAEEGPFLRHGRSFGHRLGELVGGAW